MIQGIRESYGITIYNGDNVSKRQVGPEKKIQFEPILCGHRACRFSPYSTIILLGHRCEVFADILRVLMAPPGAGAYLGFFRGGCTFLADPPPLITSLSGWGGGMHRGEGGMHRGEGGCTGGEGGMHVHPVHPPWVRPCPGVIF
jgi:hypothetical protein